MLIRDHTLHDRTTLSAEQNTSERIFQLAICIQRIMIVLLLRRFHLLPLFFGDNRLMQAVVEFIFIVLNPLFG